MDKLACEYIKYLSKSATINKPKMPNFSPSAYTENEYLLAINDIMSDFDKIDDLPVSLAFLKERNGS